MHFRTPSPARRAGFTLVELLTVIIIIGILAGILVPILGRSKDRARELAAKDLCAQVAAAWTTLALNNHRFPSKPLLEKYAKRGVKTSGGDLWFAMDPGVASVLNWWSAKLPVPEGAVRTFTPKYTMGSRKGQEITTFDGSDPPLVQCWPADQLLERSYAQKCFGVCPPWVESRLNAYLETLENAGGDPEASLPSLTDTAAHSDFVLAIIDFDADGKVTLPENVAAASGLTPEQRVLPMTAAAWTWTDPKKGRVRILTSW